MLTLGLSSGFLSVKPASIVKKKKRRKAKHHGLSLQITFNYNFKSLCKDNKLVAYIETSADLIYAWMYIVVCRVVSRVCIHGKKKKINHRFSAEQTKERFWQRSKP